MRFCDLFAAAGRVALAAHLLQLVAPASAAAAALSGRYGWDEDNVFGSVGAIFVRDLGGLVSLRCSGVLIAPDVVLTAAHCLQRSGSEDPADAEHFVFVAQPKASPIAAHVTYAGVGIATHPDHAVERLLRSPLYLRRAQSPAEESVLAQLEAACGPRDTVLSQQQWFRCVTEQSSDLQSRLGIRGRSDSTFDVALLFLAPGQLNGHALDADYLPPSETQQRLLDSPTTPRAPALSASDQLYVVGYRLNLRQPRSFPQRVVGGFLKNLFEPDARLWLETRGQQVGELEFVLQRGTQTCANASGAGVFRERLDGSYGLLGLLTQRSAAWQDDDCGEHASVMHIGPLLPWIRQSMAAACNDGTRAHCVATSAESELSH